MDKNDNSKETVKSKPKKQRKHRLGNFFKEAFSELKKVSWPTFKSVLKNTLVVLGVVAVFLLVLLGFDSLLGWGHGALLSQPAQAVSALLQ